MSLPNRAEFDALLPAIEALTRDWADRECTSFDQAIRRAAGDDDGGSIWDMPAIDSKRTVSLLVELEGLIGSGCTIPVSVITAGGYASVDDLLSKLLPKIRERCSVPPTHALVTAGIPSAISNPSPPQVVP